MALDGITVAALTDELNKEIINGRLYKIAQPEDDEILLTVKTTDGKTKRLLISAGASLPFMYLIEENKPSPLTAPNFCMLLRKHLSNGRITSITQPGLERIIRIEVEHLDELGDLKKKTLVTELMGKHSNIIFIDENNKIIDSIKHISSQVSSVREVLPGREYFIPNTENKWDFLNELDKPGFYAAVRKSAQSIIKMIYTTYTGISPVIASELCFRAGLDANASTASLESGDIEALFTELFNLSERISAGKFTPNIITDKGEPVEFAAVELTQYSDLTKVEYPSVSTLLYNYYEQKNAIARIRSRSADIRKLVSNAIERNAKKIDIQRKQLKDTDKKEKYRIYGELINTYGYSVEEGSSSFEAENYYDGKKITIPLDPTLPVMDNAKKYFDRYMKLKRTEEAAASQLEESLAEHNHLESIQNSLDIASCEEDLFQIRDELVQCGYIKKHSGKKGEARTKSNPLHYISSDGFDIYVGKNNFQNDQLTFKLANGNDWWFHSKSFPGSHVILRVGKTAEKDIPDRAFNEAGALAAYYSKGRDQAKVEIDYVIRKEVKKPAGSKPGFVVYYTNYSMSIAPDISSLKLIE
ncbi:MAG: NFACT family protein [Lachnospiraceae bacterium]|nr:NFACT family protein [Lachnospiraceae bacterium]